jgi:hypothetical protein
MESALQRDNDANHLTGEGTEEYSSAPLGTAADEDDEDELEDEDEEAADDEEIEDSF